MGSTLRATAVRTTAVLVTAVVSMLLVGCSPGDDMSAAETPVASPEATEPEETEEPSPEPTEEPDDVVLLSGTGVGDVPDGTPDALADLEALLGPADKVDESPLADCGAPFISFARWGSLIVSLDEGALYGWQLNSPDLPDAVQLPHGIELGDPFSEVAALPGAEPPVYADNYAVHMVTAEGVTWWFDDTTPPSPVLLVGHNILGCG